MPETPEIITKDIIKKLKDHINNTFNAFDENGQLDLDKCQRNVAYSLGDIFTNYNGLLLMERQKLAEIESDLAYSKAKAYDEIKMTKIKYDLNEKGMLIMLEGHEIVREKQKDWVKQKAYVQFLQNTVRQIDHYANGVKVMLQRVEVKGRYGQ